MKNELKISHEHFEIIKLLALFFSNITLLLFFSSYLLFPYSYLKIFIKLYISISFVWFIVAGFINLMIWNSVFKYDNRLNRNEFATDYMISRQKLILPIYLYWDILKVWKSSSYYTFLLLPLYLLLHLTQRVIFFISLQYVWFRLLNQIFLHILTGKKLKVSLNSFYLDSSRYAFNLLYGLFLQRKSVITIFNIFYLISITNIFGITLSFFKKIYELNENFSILYQCKDKNFFGVISVIIYWGIRWKYDQNEKTIIVEAWRIKLNPVDLIPSLAKYMRAARGFLATSFYLEERVEYEEAKNAIESGIKIGDWYDRHTLTPHLSILFFLSSQPYANSHSKWNYINYFVATSNQRIKTLDGPHKTLEIRGKKLKGGLKYIVNSCDTYNNILDGYQLKRAEHKEMYKKLLNKSIEEQNFSLNDEKSREILNTIGLSPSDVWETAQIKAMIQAKLNGKLEFIHQKENKILSIHEQSLILRAQKTGYKSYDELIERRHRILDEEITYFLIDERKGFFRAQLLLEALELIVIEEGPQQFDRVLKGLSSNKSFEFDDSILILNRYNSHPVVKKYESVLMDSL